MKNLTIAHLFFYFPIVGCMAQSPIDTLIKLTNIETSYPSWSADSKQLVFQSNRNDDDSEIYLMNTDGKGIKRLTHNPGLDEYPVIAPDNSQVAWSHVEGEAQDIFLMSIDGSKQRNVTNGAGRNIHPQYSPDGRALLFNSDRDGNFDLFLYDLASSTIEKIVGSDHPDTYAHWSPDGEKIVFVRWMPKEDGKRQGEIFVYHLRTREEQQLTTDLAFDGWPSWSHDGRLIIFSSNRGDLPNFQIFTMNPDGSEVRKITNGEQYSASFTKPVYARDGSGRIACTRTKDGNVEIFILTLK